MLNDLNILTLEYKSHDKYEDNIFFFSKIRKLKKSVLLDGRSSVNLVWKACPKQGLQESSQS